MILHEESRKMLILCKNSLFQWKSHNFMKMSSFHEKDRNRRNLRFSWFHHWKSIEISKDYQTSTEVVPEKCKKLEISCFFAENLHFHENPDFSQKIRNFMIFALFGFTSKNLHNRCIFQWFLEVESKETADFAKFPLFLENPTFSLKREEFHQKVHFFVKIALLGEKWALLS